MRALLHSLILCVAASSLASEHALASKVVSSPVHFGQRGYYTNISIGTPPQPFRVAALDIVSASLWVADSSCVEPPAPTFDPSDCPPFCKDVVFCKLCPTTCGCTGVALDESSRIAKNDHWRYCEYAAKFQSGASSTYKKDGRYFYDDSDVEGAGTDGDEAAKGFVGIDSVSVGAEGSQVVVPSNGFGQANTSTLGYFDPFDGVFGLGPAKGALSGTQSVVANVFAKGIIARPLITIASWNYLVSDKATVEDAGAITFGGLESINCGAVKKYHSIVGQTMLQR